MLQLKDFPFGHERSFSFWELLVHTRQFSSRRTVQHAKFAKEWQTKELQDTELGRRYGKPKVGVFETFAGWNVEEREARD